MLLPQGTEGFILKEASGIVLLHPFGDLREILFHDLAARCHFVPIPLEGKLHFGLGLLGKVADQALPVVRAQIAVGETRTHKQKRMRVGCFKDLPDF